MAKRIVATISTCFATFFFAQSPATADMYDASRVGGVQAAINLANAGDWVWIPSGTYVIDNLDLKPGVDLVGETPTRPILQGTNTALVVVEENVLADVALQNLRFYNTRFVLKELGNYYSRIVNVTFRNVEFAYGTGATNDWYEPYVEIWYTDHVVMRDCTFKRAQGEEGRGVDIYLGHGTIIHGSYFGTSEDLEPASDAAYFKTGINVHGYDDAPVLYESRDIKITNNTFRRVTTTCSNPEPSYCQDHGVYAWGHQRLDFVGNRGDGWDESSEGGYKFTNSSQTIIYRNRLKDSGFLLYTYYDALNPPAHGPDPMKQVYISRNFIDMLGICMNYNEPYCGTYYGHFHGMNPNLHANESDFVMHENVFTNGGYVHLFYANNPAFCVENEGDDGVWSDSGSGLPIVSGCTPSTWTSKYPGAFEGDFNADGISDLAFREGGTWKVHLSGSQGYGIVDFTDQTYPSSDTLKYGVHVGDFTGDGKPDLLYRGMCASPGVACFRVHRSNGTSFTPMNFGNNASFGSDTAKYGFLIGDFNNDGKDDLAYRGATEWMIHISDGTAFKRYNAGDGATLDPATSARYGIKVGDFDGDGKDDIAYWGIRSGVGSFRVQLSLGTSFLAAQNWSEDDYFSLDSPHFVYSSVTGMETVRPISAIAATAVRSSPNGDTT
jgi:hypothetical protein